MVKRSFYPNILLGTICKVFPEVLPLSASFKSDATRIRLASGSYWKRFRWIDSALNRVPWSRSHEVRIFKTHLNVCDTLRKVWIVKHSNFWSVLGSSQNCFGSTETHEIVSNEIIRKKMTLYGAAPEAFGLMFQRKDRPLFSMAPGAGLEHPGPSPLTRKEKLKY